MRDYNLRLTLRRMASISDSIEPRAREVVFVEHEAPDLPEHFTFELKAREVTFGDRNFEQWWMDRRSIYPLRGQCATNFRPLVDLYWESCKEHRTNLNRSQCETYILAQSLPFTRSNGARDILLDSLGQRENAQRRREVDSNLDRMLAETFDEELAILQFQRQLLNFLRQTPIEQEVFSQLSEFKSELFDQNLPALQRGEQIDVEEGLQALWSRWRNRIRRNVPEAQRQMLDILSYEAKAALHCCYSYFWDKASYWLANVERCSNASFVFHRFWHLDQIWPSNNFGEHSHFHLFYGHVFALHPGTYSFMRTATGQRLIGDWISVAPVDWQHSGAPESPQLCRLLQGLYIAIVDYSNRHNIGRDNRRQLDPTSR